MTSVVEIRGSFVALPPFVGTLFAGIVEDDAAGIVALSEVRLEGAMLIASNWYELLVVAVYCFNA